MIAVFKRIFAPSEVKVCLQILQDLKVTFNSALFPIVVEAEVANLLLNVEQTRYSILQDRIAPKHLVLMIIMNVCGRLISSGQFHTYRGLLSFRGQDLLKVWNISNGLLLKEKYIEQSEYDEDQAWIQKQIKQAG